MPGGTELAALLAAMTPILHAEEYEFVCVPPGQTPPDGIVPFATVREVEGLTMVLKRPGQRSPDDAANSSFRAITLGVHSSLAAVGFIAIIARALADPGIVANVFAGYHHDHVLVQADRAEHAMVILRGVADQARGRQ